MLYQDNFSTHHNYPKVSTTAEINTLSLHDALPIFAENIRISNNEVPILILSAKNSSADRVLGLKKGADDYLTKPFNLRSEEHTSELQSQSNLVCRLLLEKKKSHLSFCVLLQYLVDR